MPLRSAPAGRRWTRPRPSLRLLGARSASNSRGSGDLLQLTHSLEARRLQCMTGERGLSVTRDAHIRACAVCDSDLGGSAHGLVMGLVPSPTGLVDLGVPSSSPNPSREPEEVSQPQLTLPEGGARRIALSARSTSTDVPACLASNDATWNGPEDRTKPGQSSMTRRTWTDRDL